MTLSCLNAKLNKEKPCQNTDADNATTLHHFAKCKATLYLHCAQIANMKVYLTSETDAF